MNIPIKTTKKFLIITFVIITIGGILTSIYVVGLTAFGIGWAGGNKSLLGIVWSWKGLLLLTIYSIIASQGLIKNFKNGILFGFAVTICFLIYFIYDFGISLRYGNSSKIIQIIETTLYLGLTTLTIIGLNKIKKSLFEFGRKEYLTIGFLVLIVTLSFYFMFD